MGRDRLLGLGTPTTGLRHSLNPFHPMPLNTSPTSTSTNVNLKNTKCLSPPQSSNRGPRIEKSGSWPFLFSPPSGIVKRVAHGPPTCRRNPHHYFSFFFYWIGLVIFIPLEDMWWGFHVIFNTTRVWVFKNILVFEYQLLVYTMQ